MKDRKGGTGKRVFGVRTMAVELLRTHLLEKHQISERRGSQNREEELEKGERVLEYNLLACLKKKNREGGSLCGWGDL